MANVDNIIGELQNIPKFMNGEKYIPISHIEGYNTLSNSDKAKLIIFFLDNIKFEEFDDEIGENPTFRLYTSSSYPQELYEKYPFLLLWNTENVENKNNLYASSPQFIIQKQHENYILFIEKYIVGEFSDETETNILETMGPEDIKDFLTSTIDCVHYTRE